MPTILNSPIVKTLTDFTKLVEEQLAASKGGALWHRGCPEFDNDHQTPGLYRHPEKDIKKLLKLEMEMLSRFRQRSIPFVDRPLANDWQSLFFMQHFSIPTRLLDWTENPFIALYFALSSKPKTGVNGDAAVWMLDPIAWNRKSLDNITFKGEIISADDALLERLKPGEKDDLMNSDPVAIYGYHNTARIVAQRGVFTLFGKDTGNMEDIYTTKDYPQDCLLKVRVPKGEKAKLLTSLFRIGFTHSVIFPDLEGLAKEMRHSFGFTD